MPLAIDLFCGLGGWTEGLLAEGYDVIGFDIEAHVYGEHAYPAQLVVQDVLSLDGAQFRDADLIVASPPCQEYSYMAMPWRRAKQIAAGLRGEGDFPERYRGSRTLADLNRLFDACFRIQREACEAAGRHVPLVVENVRVAQPWVGRAAWSHGSYYLWGDVPALMPIVGRRKSTGLCWTTQRGVDFTRLAGEQAIKNEGGSWFRIAHNTTSGKGRNPDGRPLHTPHMTNPNEHVKNDGSGWRENGYLVSNNRMVPDGTKHGGDWFSDPASPGRQGGVKQPGIGGTRRNGKGDGWFQDGAAAHGSRSAKRKFASAMSAKIPFELARHVAAVYRPARAP